MFSGKDKRREALKQEANRLGLDYHGRDPFALPFRYGHLSPYHSEWVESLGFLAHNVICGTYRKHPFLLFDCIHESGGTHDSSSKIHRFSAGVMQLGKDFPGLVMRPEGIFDKVKQRLGFEDIDFDNDEFSKKFVVSCKDGMFARDIFNVLVRDLILGIGKITMKTEKDALMVSFRDRMGPELLQTRLDQLADIREHLPGYLFDVEGRPRESESVRCPECGRSGRYILPRSPEIEMMLKNPFMKMWQTPTGRKLAGNAMEAFHWYLPGEGNDCTHCVPDFWQSVTSGQ
jgi:hypothetical protein